MVSILLCPVCGLMAWVTPEEMSVVGSSSPLLALDKQSPCEVVLVRTLWLYFDITGVVGYNWTGHSMMYYVMLNQTARLVRAILFYEVKTVKWIVRSYLQFLRDVCLVIVFGFYICGLVKERRNSSALAMELRLSCTILILYLWVSARKM